MAERWIEVWFDERVNYLSMRNRKRDYEFTDKVLDFQTLGKMFDDISVEHPKRNTEIDFDMFQLRYKHKKPLSAIAELHGVSRERVRQRIYWADMRLAKKLKDQGYFVEVENG